MLLTLGKTKKLWLMSLMLMLPVKPKKLELPLKPNISYQNTWVSISVTTLLLVSEIQLSVFLVKKKTVSSDLTTLTS